MWWSITWRRLLVGLLRCITRKYTGIIIMSIKTIKAIKRARAILRNKICCGVNFVAFDGNAISGFLLVSFIFFGFGDVERPWLGVDVPFIWISLLSTWVWSFFLSSSLGDVTPRSTRNCPGETVSRWTLPFRSELISGLI